eukprot:2596106-Rhodomonas_salina.2
MQQIFGAVEAASAVRVHVMHNAPRWLPWDAHCFSVLCVGVMALGNQSSIMGCGIARKAAYYLTRAKRRLHPRNASDTVAFHRVVFGRRQ